MDIPTGTKRELVRSGELQPEGNKLLGLLAGMVTIPSSGQTSFSFSHIEGITLGTGEEVDEVA